MPRQSQKGLWLLLTAAVAIPTIILVSYQLVNRSTQAAENVRLDQCEQLGSNQKGRACYEDYLTDLLKKEGAEVAVRKLGVLERSSPVVKRFRHALAHTLGHAGFAHYGSLAEALSHGTMDCFAGYFHGATEVALPAAPDYSRAVKETCTGTSNRDGEFRFYQCVHGLGHGVTAFRQYDVLAALADCQVLQSVWQKEICWGGVFMENIDAKFAHAMGQKRQGRLQDDGSDFWPCLSVPEEYRSACFENVSVWPNSVTGSGALILTGGTWQV